MDGSIVERLRALLAGSTRTHSVRDLQRRGVTRIPVLGRDQLAALVEEAVAATLRDRGLLDERGEVAAEAMERAKGLLREVGRLEAEREASRRAGAEIERRVDELRREVFLAEGRLREAKVRARSDAPSPPTTVRGRIRELFAANASNAPGGIESIAAELETLLSEEVSRAVARARTEASREIEDLDRRVGRLRGALEKAESDLAARGQPAPPGIASIYRTVQGLDARERDFSRKRKLLERIFEANVRLQKETV
ncbi:MAG: gp58-like family protein [Planctomycetes bacterium]|nr:gp58-like family protein [Planctomycetota bacterium]